MEPKILYLTNGSVFPTKIGGSQRSNLLWRALSLVGKVDLVLASSETGFEPGLRTVLENKFNLKLWQSPGPRGRIGPWRLLRPLSSSSVDRLAHHLGSKYHDYGPDPVLAPPVNHLLQKNHYDLIVGRYLHPTSRAGLIGKHPLIIDVDDLDTEVYRSRAAAPGTSQFLQRILTWNASRIERVIRHHAALSDALWVCKDSDRSFPEFRKARILPNIPFTENGNLPPTQSHNPASKDILCVATWSHLPNVLGMEDFLSSSWPKIRDAVPDATLRLVGSRMQDKQKTSWAQIPGVQVVGFVESLEEAYQQSAITIAPILSGGGTNIKIVESLAFGRTCAMSSFAQRGYEDSLIHGKHVWIAQGNDLAEGCIALLTQPQLRAQLSEAGRKVVENKFSFDAFAHTVRETVESVIHQPRELSQQGNAHK